MHFYLAERNHLCNFGRGHYEHLCEIILNKDIGNFLETLQMWSFGKIKRL